MWKRGITNKVSIGTLTSTRKILLNCINIFIMKYNIKHITLPSFDKNKILVGYFVEKSDDVTNDDVI